MTKFQENKFEIEVRKIISTISILLGKPILDSDYRFNFLDQLPHKPNSLKNSEMGIYIFKYGNTFLKIGKAGSNSNARFNSQHYYPKSSNSNLAKSLLNSENYRSKGVNENNVGDWIKQNCERIEIIIDAKLSDFALSLIEAILHYKFEPEFEGKNEPLPNSYPTP